LLRDVAVRGRLRALAAHARLRLASLQYLSPQVEVHPEASRNFGVMRFNVAPTGRVVLGPGAATEYRPGAVSFLVGPGAEIVIEDGSWLRTEVAPVVLLAYDGARIHIGPGALLNGCHLTAKRSIETGERAFIGPGSRIFDSDLHDIDAERLERTEPVHIGEHTWVASDVTVFRGVTIGDHSVVGAKSLVIEDVPPHRIVVGSPARVVGTTGDRTNAR